MLRSGRAVLRCRPRRVNGGAATFDDDVSSSAGGVEAEG